MNQREKKECGQVEKIECRAQGFSLWAKGILLGVLGLNFSFSLLFSPQLAQANDGSTASMEKESFKKDLDPTRSEAHQVGPREAGTLIQDTPEMSVRQYVFPKEFLIICHWIASSMPTT